jgi:hypothetical protein
MNGDVCTGLLARPRVGSTLLPVDHRLQITPGRAAHLRLAQEHEPVRPSELARARRDVALETRRAAMMSEGDARWLFAQSVAEAIEGGRAAILRPQARRRLASRAQSMGLRSFDAHLVIAIVQDAARTGQPVEGLQARARLALVQPAVDRSLCRTLVPAVLAAFGAVALLAGLIAWIGG